MYAMASLDRRREINRKAAQKSRTRQKEMATQIKKKYYDAQSTHTKLLYEMKQLIRERDLLKCKYQVHSRSCSKLGVNIVDLIAPNLIEPSNYSAAEVSLSRPTLTSPLTRSFSWPASQLLKTSEDYEKVEEAYSLSDSSDDSSIEGTVYSSFAEKDTNAENLASSQGKEDKTSDIVLSSLSLSNSMSNTDDLSDYLGIETDDYALFDELPTSSSSQAFVGSVAVSENVPNIFDFDQPLSGFVEDSATYKSDDLALSDIGESCFDEEDNLQTEAIDLSMKRLESQQQQQQQHNHHQYTVCVEPREFTNIPLHVHNFIVGEK